MTPDFDLTTTLVAATPEEADDLSLDTIAAPFLGGKLDRADVYRFAASVKLHARLTLIRASLVVAQIRKETANFRFGGAVKPEQHNYAGIGSVNGGAAGRSFSTIEVGVGAVFAHHMSYIAGAFAKWPQRWLVYQQFAVRNAAVLAQGFGGVVKAIGDYTNGRWAWTERYPDGRAMPLGSLDNGYATSIVALANAMRAQNGGAKVATPQEVTDRLIATLRERGVEVIDVRGKLPTNKAYPYGLVRGGLGGVSKIVQHWTGDSFGRATITQVTGKDYGLDQISAAMSIDDEIDLLRWYANYHISKDGGTWGGIAYGMLVFPSGRVYVAWNIGTLTYHAFSVNGYSYALCTPNSNAQPQTPPQLFALNLIWYILFEQTPEIPAAWGDLWGHMECQRFDAQNQTSCPGTTLLAHVQGARTDGAPTVSIATSGGATKTPVAPPVNAPVEVTPTNASAVRLDVPGRGERWIVEPILTYWRDCGGVFDNPNALGWPVTGMFEQDGALVQYFDRGRVEVRGMQIASGLVGLEAAKAAGRA